MQKKSNRIGKRPFYSKRLSYEDRIGVVKLTIRRMEQLPPALGSKWREGMIAYYKRVLVDLESLHGTSGKTNSSPK